MSLLAKSKVSIEDWRQFVDEQPDGNIFHTPEIGQVFEHTKLHKPFLFTTLSDQGEILSLALSVKVNTIGWFLYRATSRCIIYGGLLSREKGDTESILRLLTSLDVEVRPYTLFTEIRNITDSPVPQSGLDGSGYKYYDYLNYLIPLNKDPEEIFSNFSRSRRQNIKKLEKSGVHVQETCEVTEILRIYDILKSTYQRVQIPLPDISLFQATFDIMYPLGMAKFYLAKMGDVEVAAAVALVYKRTIFLWYLGTKKDFLKINPASLIVWHLSKWGSQNGYDRLDFLGAGRPEEPYGVREFKKRFGGNEVNYGRYQKVYAPLLLKISEKAYGVYRKLL